MAHDELGVTLPDQYDSKIIATVIITTVTFFSLGIWGLIASRKIQDVFIRWFTRIICMIPFVVFALLYLLLKLYSRSMDLSFS